MHKSRLGNLVIDCHTGDLQQAARFWSAALGCPMPAHVVADDRFLQLETKPGEVQVILQKVEHSPRVHLDIETDAIEKEIGRLEQLGAVIVARHQEWIVMEAPTGHRFCVGKPYRGGFELAANSWT
jgi:hypothetical protein